MTRSAQPAVTSTSENRISRALHNSLLFRNDGKMRGPIEKISVARNPTVKARRAEHTWPRHAEPEDRGDGQPDIGESRELRIAPVYPGGLRISPLRMKYAQRPQRQRHSDGSSGPSQNSRIQCEANGCNGYQPERQVDSRYVCHCSSEQTREELGAVSHHHWKAEGPDGQRDQNTVRQGRQGGRTERPHGEQ